MNYSLILFALAPSVLHASQMHKKPKLTVNTVQKQRHTPISLHDEFSTLRKIAESRLNLNYDIDRNIQNNIVRTRVQHSINAIEAIIRTGVDISLEGLSDTDVINGYAEEVKDMLRKIQAEVTDESDTNKMQALTWAQETAAKLEECITEKQNDAKTANLQSFICSIYSLSHCHADSQINAAKKIINHIKDGADVNKIWFKPSYFRPYPKNVNAVFEIIVATEGLSQEIKDAVSILQKNFIAAIEEDRAAQETAEQNTQQDGASFLADSRVPLLAKLNSIHGDWGD